MRIPTDVQVRKFLMEQWPAILFCIVGAVLGALVSQGNPLAIAIALVGVLAFTGLLALVLNQGAYFQRHFADLHQLLRHTVGPVYGNSLYAARLDHFAKEKQRLAELLVREALPQLVASVCKNFPHLHTINLIIDSGTTLTPIFPLLAKEHIKGLKNKTLTIYTNSLSGIDELHFLQSNHCKLSEGDFVLLTGTPLHKYRAVTGDATVRQLEELVKRPPGQEDNAIGSVNIGLLTANWLLLSPDLTTIKLCASGNGHAEFKRKLIEVSDYRIVVSPFGKLLSTPSAKDLNALLKRATGEEYEECDFPTDRRQTTFLLTTVRPEGSLSPFQHRSQKLLKLRDATLKKMKVNTPLPASQNYVFLNGFSCEFDVSGLPDDVFATEMPHEYIRQHAKEAFDIAKDPR